jgi:hypothetical protein
MCYFQRNFDSAGMMALAAGQTINFYAGFKSFSSALSGTRTAASLLTDHSVSEKMYWIVSDNAVALHVIGAAVLLTLSF